MKKQLLIIASLALTLGFYSCKKDDNNNTQPAAPATSSTANHLFINFSLDGVAKSFTGATNQINTAAGGGAITTSGFFDLNTNIDISLQMPRDTILGADLTSLIGQKIPIVDCMGCPTNSWMSYEINGDDYRADNLNNTLPDNYFKITSVTFAKNIILFGQSLNQYYVTGEFNANLAYGSNIKNVTNGTFRLVFQEVKE